MCGPTRQPRLGVQVWPGWDKPNPYPYPAVPGRVQQPMTIPSFHNYRGRLAASQATATLPGAQSSDSEIVVVVVEHLYL